MKIISCINFLAFVACSSAQIVITADSETADAGSATFTPTYTVSTNDLINGKSPFDSAGDFLQGSEAGGLPVLTNGVFGPIGSGGAGPYPSFAIAAGGSFVTYDLGSSPLGYEISSVVVYGGWNDSGRDQQNYIFSCSLVGDLSFIALAEVDFNPAVPGGIQSATRTTITDATSPFLATGVDAVRFDFPNQENGSAGYAEIDVFGAAIIPEPSSSVMLLSGAVAQTLPALMENR